jgi:hypothetical protein
MIDQWFVIPLSQSGDLMRLFSVIHTIARNRYGNYELDFLLEIYGNGGAVLDRKSPAYDKTAMEKAIPLQKVNDQVRRKIIEMTFKISNLE